MDINISAIKEREKKIQIVMKKYHKIRTDLILAFKVSAYCLEFVHRITFNCRDFITNTWIENLNKKNFALKNELRMLGIKTTGNKYELVNRLYNAYTGLEYCINNVSIIENNKNLLQNKIDICISKIFEVQSFIDNNRICFSEINLIESCNELKEIYNSVNSIKSTLSS